MKGKFIIIYRQVPKEKAENLAKKENLQFFEVSAIHNQNISLMLYSSIVELPNFEIFIDPNKVGGNKIDIVKELRINKPLIFYYSLEKENESNNEAKDDVFSQLKMEELEINDKQATTDKPKTLKVLDQSNKITINKKDKNKCNC